MTRPTEEESLKRIVKRLSSIGDWGAPFLPCDYLVLDIETTGFSSVSNRVVSVGLCAVKDCCICNDIHSGNYANVVLKWPEEVFTGCEKAIAVHGIDYEMSQRVGVEPRQAMAMVSEAIEWARAEGLFIVGHNLQKFDAPFLAMEFGRAGLGTRIESREILDTAALCKAMQLAMLPGQDESVFDYFERVMAFRAKGVYFNLERYCVERFELVQKYGVDSSCAHSSGYDCWLTHLVVQELNKLMGVQTVQEVNGEVTTLPF